MTVNNNEIETRLILQNMGLVISIANNFRPTSKQELEEYVQAGRIGLLEAIRSYDDSKAALSTWAYQHVKWEIMRYIDKNKGNLDSRLSDIKIPIVAPEKSDFSEYLPDYLSSEEVEIIMLRRAGYTLKQIGEMLSLNTYAIGKTIKSAVEKIRIANKDE